MSTGRNTTTRDRHRKEIAKDEPDCGICFEPIDYTLPHTHPRSFVVDHIIPFVMSQDDTVANKQAAHRDCNRDKSDKLAAPQAEVFVTSRTWTP